MAVLAAWLLYRARGRTDAIDIKPAIWALLLLIPCSILTLVFWRAGVQALQLLMLPLLIWLAVLAAFGRSVARSVAVPVGYLYFSMPAWNLLSAPLQDLTLHAVSLLAPAIGLPASVSGTVVSFPNGAIFVVTTACSGVGFLAQGLAVAVLLGELEDATFARRIRLFTGMVVVALVTNWVRVLLLLLIGYRSGMDNVIVARAHLEFGYVVFVVVLVAYVWLATWRSLPPSAVARSARTNLPVLGSYVAAALALAAGPALVALWGAAAHGEPAPELQLAAGQNAWRGPFPVADPKWRPVFVGAHVERHAAYQDVNGRIVEAVAVGYPVQEQGRELINEGNSLLGDAGLTPLEWGFADADDNTYREVVTVDAEGNRSVIWSLYNIGGQTFVVPLLSQLWYGVRALTSPPYSSQFAFRAVCDASCDEARVTLRNFVQGMGSELFAVRESLHALNCDKPSRHRSESVTLAASP